MMNKSIDLNRAVRYFAYGLEILILYFLQSVPGLLPKVFSCSPIPVFAAVITIALLEPELASMGFGVFAGFIMDFYSDCPFGFYALVLSVLCCLLSVIVKRSVRVTIGSAFFSAAAGLGILFGIMWIFMFVSRGRSYPILALVNSYLPMYLYTLIITPVVYLINLGLFNGIQNRKQ